jgi:hypothetical protein
VALLESTLLGSRRRYGVDRLMPSNFAARSLLPSTGQHQVNVAKDGTIKVGVVVGEHGL